MYETKLLLEQASALQRGYKDYFIAEIDKVPKWRHFKRYMMLKELERIHMREVGILKVRRSLANDCLICTEKTHKGVIKL